MMSKQQFLFVGGQENGRLYELSCHWDDHAQAYKPLQEIAYIQEEEDIDMMLFMYDYEEHEIPPVANIIQYKRCFYGTRDHGYYRYELYDGRIV